MVKKLTFIACCFEDNGKEVKTKKEDYIETDDLNEIDNLSEEGIYNARLFSDKSPDSAYGSLNSLEKKQIVGIIKPILEKEYCRSWAVIEGLG